jgi:hypothetical protein
MSRNVTTLFLYYPPLPGPIVAWTHCGFGSSGWVVCALSPSKFHPSRLLLVELLSDDQHVANKSYTGTDDNVLEFEDSPVNIRVSIRLMDNSIITIHNSRYLHLYHQHKLEYRPPKKQPKCRWGCSSCVSWLSSESCLNLREVVWAISMRTRNSARMVLNCI